MEKISVIIITKNEELQIEECLKSVSWADEIILVDSESTDKTIDIAKKYTDKFFVKKWEGFAPQKSYALSLANNEWVLSLDADERISEELKHEILNVDLNSFDGYSIPRNNYFLHKLIKTCGWEKDSQLRLLKKCKTSVTDRLVHEGFIVNGNTGKLKSPMLHFTYNTIESAISKINHYSSLQALERYKTKGRVNGFTIIAHGIASFYKTFFALKGFRDGVHGLCIAFIDSFTTFLTYMKIWELQKNK
ncbi:MAG: glycosyltransferase family 2 protein [Ignavibacteriaceae bacterium]|nr:glycosyltransferase family 2 protein [Ignavibacteriaceae bacterium]